MADMNSRLPSARWRLQTFGGWRVLALDGSDRTWEQLHTRKTTAVLALLVTFPKQWTRDDLSQHLWHDTTLRAARNSLSASLSALRRTFGEDAFKAERHTLAANTSLWSSDWSEYRNALAIARRDLSQTGIEALNTALQLNTGPFLPELYEDIFVTRANSAEEELREVLSLHCESAQGMELLQLARRAVERFPTDWHWHEYVMRAQSQLNDVEGALRTFEKLQNAAQRTNEVVPEETRQLARELRAQELRAQELRKALNRKAAEKTILSVTRTAESSSLATSIDGPILPPAETRFFGREGEIEKLASLFHSGERLVTLSGTGGAGKTRLSLEVARALTGHFANRVFFVPLAALADSSLLVMTIRDALGLPGGSDLPPQRQIAAALGPEPALLVLDNFEQLVNEGALRLQELRDAAPGLQFLVTSRVLLGLPGEREIQVPPLRDDEAQALFFDRSGGRWKRSEYSDEVGALCRVLEGVPLAIELAAARATSFSPGDILHRLEEKLDFLAASDASVPQRHRTLRAAIEWSFDLLPAALRRFFLDLCVFRDGWTLEAACAVCQVDDWEALDFLAQLRDHSLVVANEQNDSLRFRMLVMLREWAQQQQSESELEDLRARHFAYFLQLMQANRAPTDIAAHSAQLIGELANFRAAMRWALERTDADAARDAAWLCSALYGLWDSHAYYTLGREWTMRSLRKADEPAQKPLSTAQRANLTGSGGLTLWHCSEFETARALLEESLQLTRELGEEGNEAFPLYGLGRVAIAVGEIEEGIAYATEAVAIARRRGGPLQLMSCLTTLGWGFHNTERYAEMRDTFAECLHLAEENDAQLFKGLSRTMIAFGLCNENRCDEALPLVAQALHDLEGCNNTWFTTFCQAVYGIVAREVGDSELARFLSPRALRSFDRIGTRWEVASALIDCGVLACELEEWTRAAHLFAASEALRESINHPMLRSIECHYLPALARLQAALEPEYLQQEWERGRAMSVEEALLEADALAGPQPESLQMNPASAELS